MTTRQNLTITEGQDFSFVHTHKSSGVAVDISGYTARMTIRRGYGLSLEAYLSDGSDANGGTLALGGVAGTITITMTAAQTDDLVTSGDLATIIARKSQDQFEPFIYDLEIISAAGAVTRVLEGRVILQRSVTT